MIKLRQIQFFLAVVKYNSFNKAAEYLNVSQPGISKAIHELEEIMSVKLINRLPKGIELTNFGRVLEKYSNLIMADINNAEKEIKSLKEGTFGTINIGVAFSPRIYLLPKSSINLQLKFPEIILNVYAGSRNDLLLRLLEGKIDLFVSAIVPEDIKIIEDINIQDLKFLPLYKDTQYIVTRIDHPLQYKKNIKLQDTLDFDWILPDHEKNFRLFNMNDQFLKNKLKLPIPKIVYNSGNFALNIIKNSDFLGIHPKQMIETQGNGLLAILDLEGITMEPSYGITYLANKPLRQSVKLIIEELSLVSKEMIRNGFVKEI